jgi:hypothetical protein
MKDTTSLSKEYQFKKSEKLGKAIKKNLEGLGFGT